MDRCRLLVEGQTEETFANRLLLPHLYQVGFHEVSVTIVATKRVAAGGKFKGGIIHWRQLRNDILTLANDRGGLITTVVDFYGLPADVPGMERLQGSLDARARVESLEASIGKEVSRSNFLPHLTLHETEALLYASPAAVGAHFGEDRIAAAMNADLAECGEPEAVNEGVDTAPSKRIRRHREGYVKTADGPSILADIGLPAIRAACPHLDAWLSSVEARGPSAG